MVGNGEGYPYVSRAEAAQIERILREHVLARYAVGTTEDDFISDGDLLATGLVDSMGVMEMISFVEDAFSVVVEDEDIVPANFRSVSAMTTFVAAKQASTAVET
jgi:acyl carrier protein